VGASAGLSPQKRTRPHGPWKCISHPERSSKLENHLYAQPSRLGRERWLEPESVVGTRAWVTANGGSWKRNALDAQRNGWVEHAPGAVKGEPSKVHPPVFGKHSDDGPKWVSVGARWVPPKGSLARHSALSRTCAGVDPPPLSGLALAAAAGLSQSAPSLTDRAAAQAEDGEEDPQSRRGSLAGDRRGSVGGSRRGSKESRRGSMQSRRSSAESRRTSMTSSAHESPSESGSGSDASASQEKATTALHKHLMAMKMVYPPSPAFVRHVMRHLPELPEVQELEAEY